MVYGEQMEQNNRYDNRDVIEIDLAEVIVLLLHKLWLIIFSAIVVGAATFFICLYLITPTYESTTKIYIINRQSTETLTYSDLQSGTQLTKDYQELVKSRPVLEEVRSELNLFDVDNEDLQKKITVTVPTDTRIVTITVEDNDPYMARAIADRVRTSASHHIAAVMNTEAVNVVEEANLPIEPSGPKTIRNTALGGIVGAFLAIAIIMIIYITDDTIKGPDDVEKYLGVSVLGSIPMLSEDLLPDGGDGGKKKRKKKKKKKKKSDELEHSHVVMMRNDTEPEIINLDNVEDEPARTTDEYPRNSEDFEELVEPESLNEAIKEKSDIKKGRDVSVNKTDSNTDYTYKSKRVKKVHFAKAD